MSYLIQFRFKQSCQDTGEVIVDRRIAFFCSGIAGYSGSIDGDDLLNILRQLQRCPFALFASFSWPLALRQIAKLLAKVNVEGCSAPRVRSWASKALL